MFFWHGEILGCLFPENVLCADEFVGALFNLLCVRVLLLSTYLDYTCVSPFGYSFARICKLLHSNESSSIVYLQRAKRFATAAATATAASAAD